MSSGSVYWANKHCHKEITYECNVGPWWLTLTDNFYQPCWGSIAYYEYCLVIVVQIHLREHCTRKLLVVQCWPRSTQTCFHRKITYIYNVWSACANIAEETYLCNAGPQSTNNFAPKNNLQFCLEDLSGPTMHKEIACGTNVGQWLRYNFYYSGR